MTDRMPSDGGHPAVCPSGSGMTSRVVIPRRELVTLHAYLVTGSHAQAAHALGISESTSRQRVSSLIGRLGVQNAAQAVWVLRSVLETEDGPRA